MRRIFNEDQGAPSAADGAYQAYVKKDARGATQICAKKTSIGRIGVFGGTFDPVHIGHLLLAEAAFYQAKLSLVLFMPAHIQPFKQDMVMSSDDDRIRMLRLATENNPFFDVTTIECDKGGVSYTIDSLRDLKKKYKKNKICFIIGTDMFLNIEKWKDSDMLIREFCLVVGIRPGYLTEKADKLAKKLKNKYNADIVFVDNPPIDLSSSEIRKRVTNGETIRYRVPERVRQFLLVREKQGEKRFEHTKRVIDLAVDMIGRFGGDIVKAETAALFHDYCKDPAGGVENDINHASMAAETVKELFCVKDEDILNAIRYHTTGRAGMSRLEKILFLADTIEPGRKYKSISKLRDTCLDDLDKGTLTVLVELKKYLEMNGIKVSKDTEEAIRFERRKLGQ